MSLMAYYYYKDSVLLPPTLGGKGSLHAMWTDYPYYKFPIGFKYYYLAAMGFHLYNMLKLLLNPIKTSDFVEMVCHHIVTLFLFGFSYMMNTPIGGVISLIHDISDVMICVCRFFGESVFKTATGVSVIVMLISWIYTRTIVFAQIIYAIWQVPVYMNDELSVFCFETLLTVLWVLNLYWAFLIADVVFNVILKGNTEDLQNKVVENKRKSD